PASNKEPGVTSVSQTVVSADDWTVYVCDEQSARFHVVNDIVSRCGVCPHHLENTQQQQWDRTGKHSGIALVALERGCAARDLDRIHVLKRNNFQVICYEDGFHSR